MHRVPEVIDAWYDSGSMPFAQWHFPFENEELFKERFPADYICEALDQTRGWFYSLLAVSTLLYGRSSYETCLCLGLILDPEGQKMSKSKGNVIVPWDVIDAHGADAFRWYYFTSKQPWDGYRFSLDAVGESVRQFMLQLWNTYGFFVMYANVNDADGSERPAADAFTDLDAWALSRLSATDGDGGRAPRRLRHDRRRPRDRGVRRRPVELVRAPLAAALLGRRPGRVLDAARVPADGVEAARPADAVRGRRDLREPGRLASRRSTSATSPSRASATSSSRRRWRSRATRSSSGARRGRTRS